uniref:Uncharacterized protein n=1 Tax=Anas platyrhynchos platyrhynchos TaxID=8840 RepID=A0A493T139_ANAPP
VRSSSNMGAKLLCFCLASALVSYYIYTPIPENIEEGWKVMLVTSLFRTVGHAQEDFFCLYVCF